MSGESNGGLQTVDLEPLLDVLAEKVAARMPEPEDKRWSKVTKLEPFVGIAELSDFLAEAAKERWMRARIKDGMPHHLIAGKVRFRVSEVVPWLERHGHIVRRGQ